MPKSWQTATGCKVECADGPLQGQWFRQPEPKDQSLPFQGGITYDLRRNHPGYKYEWCYVLRKATT